MSWLQGTTIGISISESEDIKKEGFGMAHLRDTMVEIAQQLLYAGANLAYGGDVNYVSDFNFVQILFDLVRTYRIENNPEQKRVKNYLAKPVQLALNVNDLAKLSTFMELVNVGGPDESDRKRQTENLQAVSQSDQAYWASSLTHMRHTMNEGIDARILLGGKQNGYKGSMPGIIEEGLIALKTQKPLFLIGAYGGATKLLINWLHQGPKTIEFPYSDSEFSIDNLQNGLSIADNRLLFSTPNKRTAIQLIMKGLRNLLRDQ